MLRPVPAVPPPAAQLYVLTLGGRAETQDSGVLQEFLHQQVLERDPRWNFLVNVANLDYLSSTALRIFVDLDMYKAEALHVAGGKEKLLRSLETVGLAADRQRGIALHVDVKAALESLGLPPEVFQLCATDELRVGRDPRGFAKEVDLLKWSSRERVLGLHLAKDLFRLDRLFTDHFEKAPVLVVPTETRYGVLIFKFLKRILAEAGLYREIRKDPRFLDEDDLEVLTKELLENAIDHGYRGRGHGLVAVEARHLEDRFELAFSDFGEGYNPGFLRRMVGRGGLGLTRLQRMFALGGGKNPRRNLGILSPTPVDPAPLVEVARRVYPDRSTWQVGPGTTILLTRYR